MCRLVFVLTLLLAGCAYTFRTPRDVTDANRAKLEGIRVGMTRAEVVATMGPGDYHTVPVAPILPPFFYVPKTLPVPSPYRSEMYPLSVGGFAEVLYFYTDVKQRDGAVTEDELTPVILVDGTTIGWGRQLLLDQRLQVQR